MSRPSTGEDLPFLSSHTHLKFYPWIVNRKKPKKFCHFSSFLEQIPRPIFFSTKDLFLWNFFVRDKVYIELLDLYAYIRRLDIECRYIYIYILYKFSNINHTMYIKFKKNNVKY